MTINMTLMRSLTLAAVFALGLLLITGCGGDVKEDVAVLETTHGEIVIGFYQEDAPNHVANFKKLASEGVYDSVIFHRIIPGFMIQTGDPNTANDDYPQSRWGTGGTGNNLQAEFNERHHERGILSMARAQDPNSADSQFFIVHEAAPHLDGQYTVFGKVLRGMEAVDSIAAVPTDMRDRPKEDVRILKAKIVAKEEAGLE